MKKKVIIAGVAVCLVGVIAAVIMYMNRVPDFVYTKLEDGTYELSNYWGEETEVEIPAEYRGKPVTRIGNSCFSNWTICVTKVIIPESVNTVGYGAFEGCKNLTIEGTENIRKVESYAFAQCELLEEVSFQDLEKVGKAAFCDMEGLGEVSLSDELTRIGEFAFWGTDIEDINLGENISFIGDDAFMCTPWLKEQQGTVIVGDGILIQMEEKEQVVIPEGIKMISTSRDPSEIIKELYIPESVTCIDNCMLYGTEGITIYIPSSVEQIGGFTESGEDNISFEDMDKVTLVVEAGSYAEEYAKRKAEEKGLKYQVVEKIEYPTNEES